LLHKSNKASFIEKKNSFHHGPTVCRAASIANQHEAGPKHQSKFPLALLESKMNPPFHELKSAERTAVIGHPKLEPKF
jgi:hypothetical protein